MSQGSLLVSLHNCDFSNHDLCLCEVMNVQYQSASDDFDASAGTGFPTGRHVALKSV
jgi:hypothetical protein